MMTTKPKCIIVTGPPGSGKTTLAKNLAEHIRLPLISRDEIKEGYVNTHGVKHDQLPRDTNAMVSEFFFETVSRYLDAQISVIIEAAFQHKVWASRMPHILSLARTTIILCAIDANIAARRHLERGLRDPDREFYHGDPRVAHYRATGEFLPPAEYEVPDFDVLTIRVSTDGEYIPSLEGIVTQFLSTTR